MTYLDAAYQILQQVGQPLRYEEITERALAQQLILPQGQTPEATMASRLYMDTLQEGSRFTRAGKGTFGLVVWQPAGIEAQVEKINEATLERLHSLLFDLAPDRFQALIEVLLISMGFDENTVIVNKISGDGGLDVVGVYRATGLVGVNVAVQVKRWRSNVSAPIVRSLRGSLQVHQQGIVITTSDFSKGARVEATAPNKTHIWLIDGKELVRLLARHNVGVEKKSYDVISLDDGWWGEFSGLGAPTPAVVAPESASVGLAEPPDLEHDKPRAVAKKPASFTFLGQSYSATSWPQLLVTLCQIMAERHPDDFVTRALTVRGPRRHHIAAAPDGMINPVPVGVADLWLEANQSSRTAQRVALLILETFGYAHDDLTVMIHQEHA